MSVDEISEGGPAPAGSGATAPWLLDARSVVVRYDARSEGRWLGRGDGHRPPAVDYVSISIRPGEIVGLVGESGCGKSTLARVLAGLQRPLSGHVFFDGNDLYRLDRRSLRRLRRRLRMIFQSPDAALNAELRVRQILDEVLRAQTDLPRAGRRQRAADLLAAVSLPASLAERYPHELSGGQKRRVGIAAALAGDPAMLIADEPLAGLDAPVQGDVLALFRRLRETRGLSILMISHDIGSVKQICSHVVSMYQARVMESGPRALVVYPEKARHPYTLGLLAADFAVGAKFTGRGMRRQDWEYLDDVARDADHSGVGGCALRPRCFGYLRKLDPEQRRRCERDCPVLRTLEVEHRLACHYAPEVTRR